MTGHPRCALAAASVLPLFLHGCAAPAHVARGSERPPDVVFILADDMGYGDPRCYDPDSRIATPHIDRLAREGVRFTDAHAPGSVCVPSRYGLLTGRYPCRVGRFPWRRQAVIEAGRVTIASLLRDHGYATAMVGKWHQGFDGGPDHDFAEPLRGGPVDRGFDTWLGIPASLDIPPYYWVRDRTPLAAPTERVAASHTAGWTDIQGAFWRAGQIAPGFDHADVLPRFGREAVRIIDEHARRGDGDGDRDHGDRGGGDRGGGGRGDGDDDRPLFLYVALTAPHTPWLPAEEYRGQSGASLYGDFVTQVDDTVGQILAALDRSGMTGRTLVIFTSDNGPVWYPRDVERFGHRASGDLRGMKGDAWEGGHRVPFLVRWPERAAAGAVRDQTICFTDVMATLADAAGAELPEGAGEDSVSFLPALCGAASGPVRDVTILKANASVIREGRWKLITHLGSGGFSQPRRAAPANAGDPTGQLYDLERDRGETTDLWAERPDVVARLTELLRPFANR